LNNHEEFQLKILITTTMIYLLLLATNVNSDTLFFDTEINIDGSDNLMPPADPTILFGLGGPNLGALPRFNPATGTLVSATLIISGNLDYEFFIESDAVIDDSLSNEMLAELEFGIGGVVPLSTGVFLTPLDTGFDTVDCFAAPSNGPCSEFIDGSFSADANEVFTGADLAAFIGAGGLDSLSTDLVYGLNSFSSENLDGSAIEVNLFFDGTASIEYEFTPVPVPAAMWLFGSGLLGMAGLSRRNKA
jgi:hypothetical protein